MKYVIAYDIRNDDSRASVAALLSLHGVRVQKSVFDCMIATTELSNVVEAITRQMNEDHDTLHVFPQCETCHDRRDEWGQVNRTMSQYFWIV